MRASYLGFEGLLRIHRFDVTEMVLLMFLGPRGFPEGGRQPAGLRRDREGAHLRALVHRRVLGTGRAGAHLSTMVHPTGEEGGEGAQLLKHFVCQKTLKTLVLS